MANKPIRQAVILAAGRGERLWPYGDTNPKAALPVGNRPLIHYHLDALASAGVQKVSVVTGWLEGMVRIACRTWNASGSHSLEIVCVAASASKGTADSALIGLRALGKTEDPALILPGDLYFQSSDLRSLVESFDGKKVHALVSPLPKSQVKDSIRAEVVDSEILEIKAHSREHSENSMSLSRILAVPGGFDEALAATPEIPTCVEIGAMPPAERELAETVHQVLRSGNKAIAILAKETLIDIDGPWDFLASNSLCCGQRAGALKKNDLGKGASIDPSARVEGFVRLGKNSKIGPGVIVYGNLWVGDNTTLTDGAYLEPNSIIGDDCLVWRGALVGKNTVVGHRCVVGHGAEVEGLMMDESYSYHYGEFWGVLGKCCDLGAATVCGTLRFDDGETAHRVKGRRVVPRHHSNATFLGDYVRTGVNAILMPGVKVGSYSLVGAGVLLSGDIPNNTSVYIEQEHKRGSWGPEKYGW
jgi:bifunctional UDP-N-acetylglucosamine pyrophosphorylase/glucosamine-1-phosphate N-acetyltransferase